MTLRSASAARSPRDRRAGTVIKTILLPFFHLDVKSRRTMYLTPFSEPPSSSRATAREPITDVTNTARANNKTNNNAPPFVPPKNETGRRQTRFDAHRSTPSLNLIPVSLAEEGIEDGLAAHLASSLVAHILWSRGQVPLPLPQLAKMQAFEEDEEEVRAHRYLGAGLANLTP